MIPDTDAKGATSSESAKPTENKADSDKDGAGTPKPKPAANIVDGDMVRIASPHGQIELQMIVTKDIVAGVVAVPHGWGHKGTGGWRLANGAGGANVNRLMSGAPEDLERLAGMARLTGVPVRVSRS
jgi:hypothetical protein